MEESSNLAKLQDKLEVVIKHYENLSRGGWRKHYESALQKPTASETALQKVAEMRKELV